MKMTRIKEPSISDRAAEVIKRLKGSARVVYDVETSGLDWRRNHIVGHVFTFGAAPQDTYYIPVRHAGGGNLEGTSVPKEPDSWDRSIHPFERIVGKVLRDRGRFISVCGHAVDFDAKFASRLGIDLICNFLEDTQVNAFILNEYMNSFSLDACCRWMKVQDKKGEDMYAHMATLFGGEPTRRAQMQHYWRLAGNDPLGVDYAEGDGTSTWQLRDAQMAEIDAQELMPVWDIESRCIPALLRMMLRGVRIDVEYLHKLKTFVEEEHGRLASKLPEDFNERAPSQMVKFFTDNGLKDAWPRTEKGNPSFPEAWLLTNEPGQRIVAARKYGNLLNSFINPMLDRHLWNGRVHTEYHQTRSDDFGTVTARLSSSNPNLQQVHKRNVEMGALFRSIFIPDDGMEWASVDYSQCEPRLLSHYGKVKLLVDGYNANPPIDAHTNVASVAFAGGQKPTKDQREMGKRLNQALITGAGPRKACAMMGMSEKEGMPIIEDFFRRMPEIKKLQMDAASTLRSRGWIKSLLGRRVRLDDPRFAYKAVNRLLQVGNADMLKWSLVAMDDYLTINDSPIGILNNVHDSFDFQKPKDGSADVHYNECLRIMVDDCKETLKCRVPFAVEDGVGPNWAVATYGAARVAEVFKEKRFNPYA